MPTPRRTRDLSLLVLAAHALAIALACGGPSVEGREDEPSNNLFSSSDPLDSLFGSPKVDQRGAARPEQEPPTPDQPADPEPVKAQPATPQQGQRASFFVIPSGWGVERHSAEAQMYKLVHPNLPNASIVLSTQTIEGEGDVQERLRTIHNDLVSKLPSSFKRVELREWLEEDDAHILTRLRGARSDSSEVAVTGHSIARARRAYLILGASSPAQSAELQRAIDAIIPTIQSPSSQPTARLTTSKL